MPGLAHNLIHKKCAELWRSAGMIHWNGHGMACLNFAQHKNNHINQGCSIQGYGLLTILSTECVQNCINRFLVCPGFPRHAQAASLPYFWALKKNPFKSRVLHGVNRLAHNLIHTLCVELYWRWKSIVWRWLLAWKPALFTSCYIFMQDDKNDINQVLGVYSCACAQSCPQIVCRTLTLEMPHVSLRLPLFCALI